MKKYLLLLVALICVIPFSGHALPYSFNKAIISRTLNIPNGWYSADVKYYNAKTYYSAHYTLKVYVQYGSVVTIAFSNGGSYHTGLNNEGYTYSGGYLMEEADYQGNVTSATARVTIYDQDGYKNFDISIS